MNAMCDCSVVLLCTVCFDPLIVTALFSWHQVKWLPASSSLDSAAIFHSAIKTARRLCRTFGIMPHNCVIVKPLSLKSSASDQLDTSPPPPKSMQSTHLNHTCRNMLIPPLSITSRENKPWKTRQKDRKSWFVCGFFYARSSLVLHWTGLTQQVIPSSCKRDNSNVLLLLRNSFRVRKIAYNYYIIQQLCRKALQKKDTKPEM